MVGDGTWLTVGEVAKLFGVDDNTARKWVEQGLLDSPVKSWRLPTGNRDRRISRESADRYLREIQGLNGEEGTSTS